MLVQALARLDIKSRTAHFAAASGGNGDDDARGGAARDGSNGDDGRTRECSVAGVAGDPEVVPYDLLVGADGVNSRVRAELAAQVPACVLRFWILKKLSTTVFSLSFYNQVVLTTAPAACKDRTTEPCLSRAPHTIAWAARAACHCRILHHAGARLPV